MQAQIEQIKARVQECIAIAEDKYSIKLPKVDVRFDLKGRAAGQAGMQYGRFFLRFNRNHIQLGGQTFSHLLNDTVPHEVAHFVCFSTAWSQPRCGLEASLYCTRWQRSTLLQ